MSLSQKLRTRAQGIAAAGLAGPVEEQALQRRLTDALAGDLSFAAATVGLRCDGGGRRKRRWRGVGVRSLVFERRGEAA